MNRIEFFRMFVHTSIYRMDEKRRIKYTIIKLYVSMLALYGLDVCTYLYFATVKLKFCGFAADVNATAMAAAANRHFNAKTVAERCKH